LTITDIVSEWMLFELLSAVFSLRSVACLPAGRGSSLRRSPIGWPVRSVCLFFKRAKVLQISAMISVDPRLNSCDEIATEKKKL